MPSLFSFCFGNRRILLHSLSIQSALGYIYFGYTRLCFQLSGYEYSFFHLTASHVVFISLELPSTTHPKLSNIYRSMAFNVRVIRFSQIPLHHRVSDKGQGPISVFGITDSIYYLLYPECISSIQAVSPCRSRHCVEGLAAIYVFPSGTIL